MLKFLSRLILVPLGFVLGALAAVAVLLSLGSERITQAISANGDVSLTETWALLQSAVVLTSAMTLVPALLLVIAGEVARIRTIYYYVAGGGAALAATPLIARFGEAGAFSMPNPAVWQVFATAGFLGGFVYWLIAGRST
ncbi:MAG TPA: hypothetical protein VMX97_03540 [Hyphomicrobiaceae bacterium]|nr:hypothetical protein [Hyphomicrobiaceae bacterium]